MYQQESRRNGPHSLNTENSESDEQLIHLKSMAKFPKVLLDKKLTNTFLLYVSIYMKFEDRRKWGWTNWEQQLPLKDDVRGQGCLGGVRGKLPG